VDPAGNFFGGGSVPDSMMSLLFLIAGLALAACFVLYLWLSLDSQDENAGDDD
jgi:hypothetical protein